VGRLFGRKWEGDTLVVDSAGFNDKGWLDVVGHPHSEELRIQERFHRRDFGHMIWHYGRGSQDVHQTDHHQSHAGAQADSDILETVCNETRRTARISKNGNWTTAATAGRLRILTGCRY